MLSCNGCKNKNTWRCADCVGWNKYTSDTLMNPTLAIDISKEMKLLDKAKKLAVFAAKQHFNNLTKFDIEKVIFNYPATIVIWADGTKTIVKSGDYDVFDPEKGLAMAIAKKALGNQGNYYEVFKKWLPEEKEEEELSPLDELKKALANLTIPKPSIVPIVKHVKATNIGEDGILVEGELTKTGEKFFEKVLSKEPSGDDNQSVILLTPEELAEKLSCTKATIQKRCRQGLYPGAEKVSGKWKIPYTE